MATPGPGALPKASVLYSVYRPLIRLAPSDELKDHIRRAFRRHRNLTQPVKISRRLNEAHEVSHLGWELSASRLSFARLTRQPFCLTAPDRLPPPTHN